MEMKTLIPPFCLEFDPRLMESAVMLRIVGHPLEAEFHQERDRAYEVTEEEERDQKFNQLHRQWFLRLDLGRSVGGALDDYSVLMRDTSSCRVMLAVFAKEEGADLYGAFPRTIVLKLRPASLLEESTLLTFLRHEFMHLTDMLDPCFAYQPELPKSEAGPTYDNLLRERYRVLWDTWIDGRLHSQGRAPAGVKQERRAEFKSTFPMLGESWEGKFSQWFDWPVHRHQDLVAFALHPESGEAQPASQQVQTGRCPLCRFPSFDFAEGRNLSSQTVEEIVLDFPDWSVDQGLCRQCSDLYETRPMSRLAEAKLPTGYK